MNRRHFGPVAVILVVAGMLLAGCAATNTDPVPSATASSLEATNVIAQDVSQLKSGGVAGSTSVGVFSIGWKQFVGPNIVEAGTIGKAYAVVRTDTALSTRGHGGIDIGDVSISVNGSTTVLTKQVDRDGEVLYSTFPKGLRDPSFVPVNIPFVGGATYDFAVTGSAGFSAGTFSIAAPASLIDITNHENHDTVSIANDLTLTWTGGSPTDSVRLRIVPHLRREQVHEREDRMGGGPHGGPHGGRGGRGPGHGHGSEGGELRHGADDSTEHGMPFNLGPEFHKGVMLVVANTGSFTISAADLQTLIAGTEASELMIGVGQEISQDVSHDGKTVTVLLRNGDRIVLRLQ